MALYIALGLLAGVIIGFFIGKNSSGQSNNQSLIDDYKQQIEKLESKLAVQTQDFQDEIKKLTEENGALKGRIKNSLQVYDEQQTELQKVKTEKDD